MKILKSQKIFLQQSGLAAALTLENFFPERRAKIAVWFCGTVSLAGFALAALFLEEKNLAFRFLGLGEASAAFFLTSLLYYLFLHYLKTPKKYSLEEIKTALSHEAYGRILSFASAKILMETASGDDLHLPVFFQKLLQGEEFLWILRRLNINSKSFGVRVKENYPETAALSLSEVLRAAWQKSLSGNHFYVELGDVMAAVWELDKIFQKIMFDYEIEKNDFEAVVFWQGRYQLERREKTKWWHRHNLLNTKGIGKDWQGGYTVMLDRVALDLTEAVKYKKPSRHLFGHRKTLEIMEQTLIRPGGASNVVMVGSPGVGRHTMLRAFAAKVNSGETYGPLRYQRVLQLDSTAIISGAASLNIIVEKIQAYFGEALLAQNVILVIQDIDAFLDSAPEAGRVNATEALLPFLQSRLKIIGVTTPSGYQNTIGKNQQLLRLFSKLEVAETAFTQTLLILEDEVLTVERDSGLFFTFKALEEIVNLATRLIQNLPNPEKSLEILEETAVFTATKTADRIVAIAHVQKVVTARTKIPVGKVEGKEKGVLLNLENILHERIVNQHEGITEIANALRRARAGIRSEKRPIGSFLFLGPTGVGKTETAKSLAAIYFGSESRMIRFDMSEFQEIHSVSRLIGDADTRTGGLLTEAVIANPFGLILLDEIEKAHPKILDLFLQVLDEGRLTDALGRAVSFVNTMIIATSNAGAEMIREMIKAGKNPAESKQEVLDEIQRHGLFRPEFLNRFDAVVVFRPLQDEELAEVAILLLQELNSRLAEKDIQIKITPKLAATVVAGGFSAEFGARPLRRFIQDHVENYIAKGLLSGSIQRGQLIEINPEML